MSLYVDSEIPRHVDENEDGLSELEKIERDRAIDEIVSKYPNTSWKMAEMCWNYIHRKGVVDIREKINSGFFKKPSKYAVAPGGTIKGGYVYNADGSLYDPEVDDKKEGYVRGDNIISC